MCRFKDLTVKTNELKDRRQADKLICGGRFAPKAKPLSKLYSTKKTQYREIYNLKKKINEK